MTEEILIPAKATKVLSIKIDAYIDKLIEKAATQYGFDTKSDFLRFIICAILIELNMLDQEDEYLCYKRLKLNKNIHHIDDPELEIALASTIARLRGLAPEDAHKIINNYVDLLKAVSML